MYASPRGVAAAATPPLERRIDALPLLLWPPSHGLGCLWKRRSRAGNREQHSVVTCCHGGDSSEFWRLAKENTASAVEKAEDEEEELMKSPDAGIHCPPFSLTTLTRDRATRRSHLSMFFFLVPFGRVSLNSFRLSLDPVWREKSDWTGYKELGVEKSGKNAEGDSWWETWQEVLYQEEWSNLSKIERSAPKQAKPGTETAGWYEKWWEKYDAKGWTEKGTHKYGRLNEQSWWEKWGEHYDGIDTLALAG